MTYKLQFTHSPPRMLKKAAEMGRFLGRAVKRLCWCLNGRVKEPYEMSMAWEPDHRSDFFLSPPAHLCTVTYITEISLIVTLNNHSLTHRMFTFSFIIHNLKCTRHSGIKGSGCPKHVFSAAHNCVCLLKPRGSKYIWSGLIHRVLSMGCMDRWRRV